MEKPKTTLMLTARGTIDLEEWLTHMREKHPELPVQTLRDAAVLARLAGEEQSTPNGETCLHQGLSMAEILAELHVDSDTLKAGIVYASVRYAELNMDDLTEQLGKRVPKLIQGVIQMDAIRDLHEKIYQKGSQQLMTTIDNLRKMFLAVVDDVRVVLIKLAEYLCILHNAKLLNDDDCKRYARETRDIFAPLANRLGMGHLKWQLEDFAFRYLEPETYKKLTSSLNEKRTDREAYVQTMLSELDALAVEVGLDKYDITGRAKHIFSIHKKMQRKNVDINEIYDTTAMRILVPTIEDCYRVLSHIHAKWDHIEKEFDDYVAKPKPNGYRSIHTAIHGPGRKHVEIQIRTFEMHEESELGVAAHWAYKEGARAQLGYQEKIAWLRQVMDWQKEVTESEEQAEEIESQIFSDRVYVFTPNGDVMDLVKGATPLDFAYSVHSDVGNRCRGAKVNDHIVPLTYELKTGDQVEVLTQKNATPSRDWINPQLGYLKSPRARAKVLTWFRHQDYEINVVQGQDLYEKELKRQGHQAFKEVDLSVVAKKHHYKNEEDFLAALGRGDVSVMTLVSDLKFLSTPEEEKTAEVTLKPQREKRVGAGDIMIEGVGKLLTSVAKCCKPVPGDLIVGYVTLGRGVSIHRKDCGNILKKQDNYKERILNVSWGEAPEGKYSLDLTVDALNRSGLVQEIVSTMSAEKVMVTRLNTFPNDKDGSVHIAMTVEIESIEPFNHLIQRLKQLPDVYEVKREG